MKPGIGSYDAFKDMFERFSKEAGKEQYLIPYFIAAHPGTTDEDMLNLALWLTIWLIRPAPSSISIARWLKPCVAKASRWTTSACRWPVA